MIFANFPPVMDQSLHELSTPQLNNLFLEESGKFLALLNSDPNSIDLQLIKMKVKMIMDILDARKDSSPSIDMTKFPDPSSLEGDRPNI